MLRLTFLGTGTSQGVPMIGCRCEVCRSSDHHDKRLRSSVMIERLKEDGVPCENPEKNVLERVIIDSGPDFRYQMLRDDVEHIDAIVLTHEHKDHIAGLDEVRGFNYFQQQAIPVFASERTARVVRKDFDYAFGPDKYPGAPEIDLRIIDPATTFSIGSLPFMPISGLHHRLPVLGFRTGKLAYLTDFNYISDAELEKLHGVELLVVGALRHEEHISHYNVGQAIELGRLAGAHETYLTHASHQIGLWQQTERSLPKGFHLAYDGLKILI